MNTEELKNQLLKSEHFIEMAQSIGQNPKDLINSPELGLTLSVFNMVMSGDFILTHMGVEKFVDLIYNRLSKDLADMNILPIEREVKLADLKQMIQRIAQVTYDSCMERMNEFVNAMEK